MIVYVLFVHKNQFQREKFVLFSLKIKNLKNPKKTFLVGFFRCFFFWVGFLLPNLEAGGFIRHTCSLLPGPDTWWSHEKDRHATWHAAGQLVRRYIHLPARDLCLPAWVEKWRQGKRHAPGRGLRDPLSFLIRIPRIQHFRLNTDLDLDLIRFRVLMTKNLNKIYSWKKNNFFKYQNYNLTIPRPP